jgi:hypothetical protein
VANQSTNQALLHVVQKNNDQRIDRELTPAPDAIISDVALYAPGIPAKVKRLLGLWNRGWTKARQRAPLPAKRKQVVNS